MFFRHKSGNLANPTYVHTSTQDVDGDGGGDDDNPIILNLSLPLSYSALLTSIAHAAH